MRIRRRGWWVLAGQAQVLAAMLVLAAPGIASACEVARFPYLSEAVATADRVLVIRIVGSSGDPDYPRRYVWRVERVIRGAAPRVMRVAAPMTTACGDRLQAKVGDRVLIAFGVQTRSVPVSPEVFLTRTGGIDPNHSISLELPASVDTLDEIAAAFGSLPPTDSVAADASAQAGEPSLAVLLGLVGAACLRRRLGKVDVRD